MPAGSEEIDATQPLITLLLGLGWPATRLRTRPQWKVPKTPSEASRREVGQSYQGFPCDIVLFATAEQSYEKVQIICECKKPTLDAGVEQLKTYLNLEPAARIGIWYNGKRHAIVYRDGQGGYEVDAAVLLPRPGESLDYTRPDRVLRTRDLEDPPSMKILFESVRDYLAAQDEQVSRDELLLMDLANLLMCKLLDERDKQDMPDAVLDFQIQEPEIATGPHIRALFARIQAQYPSIFPDLGQKIEVTDRSIAYVVRKLQAYRFLGHDRHSVGDAFQVLRGKAVKGEEGQFFTPGPVVRAAVRLLNPTERDKIIDPAGGTGGFVALILDHVYRAIELSGVRVDERKLRWVNDRLFMIDKDAVGVRFAKSYLTLMNNGAHVYQADSVRPTSPTAPWTGRRDDLDRQVTDGSFDLILTNPPFGEDLVLSRADGRREGYQFSHKWKLDRVTGVWSRIAAEWQDRQIGLIFLERCLQLLSAGGRMAIVLPETFLFSRDFGWLVDYLTLDVTIEYIINLPMVTFEEFCRAKTCLVVLRKKVPAPDHRIIFSFPESVGFDRHGKVKYAIAEDGSSTEWVDDELSEAIDLLTTASSAAAGPTPTKFRIPVLQQDARAARVLLPQYYWRVPAQAAFDAYCAAHDCGRIALGALADAGFITHRAGHGSPPPVVHGKGPVPYIKVVDVKNWRILENSSYGVPQAVAARMWGAGGPDLESYEMITPSRASKNIGMWAVVMPWQRRLLLTKEFLRVRVADPLPDSDPTGGLLAGFDWAFLLYAMSLRVVREQYRSLVLMQTNREDLGSRWKEVIIPLPRNGLATWGDPVRAYFDGLVRAKISRDAFLPEAGHDLADWPL